MSASILKDEYREETEEPEGSKRSEEEDSRTVEGQTERQLEALSAKPSCRSREPGAVR